MSKCTGCGKFCLNENYMLSLSASKEDILRWEEEDREDILQYVGRIGDSGDLWISPVTGEELSRCPFLRKVRNEPRYICKIQDTKPATCRGYPYNIRQMKNDGCEIPVVYKQVSVIKVVRFIRTS